MPSCTYRCVCRVIEFINNVVATLIGVLAIYLFYIMLYKGRYE